MYVPPTLYDSRRDETKQSCHRTKGYFFRVQIHTLTHSLVFFHIYGAQILVFIHQLILLFFNVSLAKTHHYMRGKLLFGIAMGLVCVCYKNSHQRKYRVWMVSSV